MSSVCAITRSSASRMRYSSSAITTRIWFLGSVAEAPAVTLWVAYPYDLMCENYRGRPPPSRQAGLVQRSDFENVALDPSSRGRGRVARHVGVGDLAEQAVDHDHRLLGDVDGGV